MAKNKTVPTLIRVDDFLKEYANTEQKLKDAYTLIEMMQDVTGKLPYMWGPTIVGFGTYHYKYASGHEGSAPCLGFSPRKAEFSLYVYSGLEDHSHLLEGLGKYKMGKACIYVKKLEDINIDQLRTLMEATVKYLKETYTVAE